MDGRTSMTLYPHMDGLNEKAAPPLFNRAFQLTASLDVRDQDACEGVLLSLGGRFGGLSLYVVDGVPVFYYNFFRKFTGEARAVSRLTPGAHEVQLRFEYDGGIAAGATLRLFVDDEEVGQGRIDVTAPAMFSMNETMDVGRSRGSAVSEEYSGAFGFTGGTLRHVRVDIQRGTDLPWEERARIDLATH